MAKAKNTKKRKLCVGLKVTVYVSEWDGGWRKAAADPRQFGTYRFIFGSSRRLACAIGPLLVGLLPSLRRAAAAALRTIKK